MRSLRIVKVTKGSIELFRVEESRLVALLPLLKHINGLWRTAKTWRGTPAVFDNVISAKGEYEAMLNDKEYRKATIEVVK